MPPPLELSIPTTSLHTPPDGTKPYTLYNITLRLPLRSFVVQKRYSDFAALHESLTSLIGSPPPEPLPAKSWFRSTVSSPELTEERRAGLERYLRAVAEPPDRRWRDTPAWRAFLNLPSQSGASVSGLSVEGRIPAIGLRDANLAAASDPATWVDLNKEMKRELNLARAALERKERAPDAAEQADAEGQARKALVKAGSLLGPLEEGLGVMREAGRMAAGEYNRRRGLMGAAKEEKSLLDQWASRAARRGSEDRGKLLSSPTPQQQQRTAARRVLGGPAQPLPETDETRELDNEGVLARQRLTMEEQDARVGVLGSVVDRLNRLGADIYTEVETHNEMLDEANRATDSLQRKLGVGNRRARNL
ncbi:Phox homologous domain-containing protein [Staphylotrichum tortipilum]|uniref:Phox homologous domain-containing protein n=1 Tax=Staphylotrichum tortipilum TaxID=2831512 RepID=A0AAN6RQQ2_9PEZI|nr:Phox homologous domain-containing protein [Staphylotrichum longicolle]